MPQLRKDPVTREWVIIATERSRRPTDFTHKDDLKPTAFLSPSCPFCPGNELMTPPEAGVYRAPEDQVNGPGWWVRAFPNKFPALRVEGSLESQVDGLYESMAAVGAHEVIVEAPEHNKSLGALAHEQAVEVIRMYRERFAALRNDTRLRYLMLFKNYGRVAGASLEHPHSQLIATPMVPRDVQEKLDAVARYRNEHERCLYCDILRQELHADQRIVAANARFVAFCPFASRYPFEVWIAPRSHQQSFDGIDNEDIQDFASILQDTLKQLRVCLNDPPYNMTLHTAPINDPASPDFHWHVSIMPRLSIAAGFEMGTGIFINVTAPEDAAAYLRAATLSDADAVRMDAQRVLATL